MCILRYKVIERFSSLKNHAHICERIVWCFQKLVVPAGRIKQTLKLLFLYKTSDFLWACSFYSVDCKLSYLGKNTHIWDVCCKGISHMHVYVMPSCFNLSNVGCYQNCFFLIIQTTHSNKNSVIKTNRTVMNESIGITYHDNLKISHSHKLLCRSRWKFHISKK